MNIHKMGKRENKPPVRVRDLVLRLGAAVEWMHAGDTEYGPGFFERVISFQSTIASREPGSLIRLWNTESCWACRRTVDVTRGRHDHIIATSQGGSPEAFNRAPACRACNVGRGAIDPLVFFSRFGSFWDLGLDFVVVYARSRYRHSLSDGSLGEPAEERVLALLDEFVAALPTVAHRDRFLSIYARSAVAVA